MRISFSLRIEKEEKKNERFFLVAHFFRNDIVNSAMEHRGIHVCVWRNEKKKFINFIIIDKSDEKRSEWLVYCEINKYDAFILYYVRNRSGYTIVERFAVRRCVRVLLCTEYKRK